MKKLFFISAIAYVVSLTSCSVSDLNFRKKEDSQLPAEIAIADVSNSATEENDFTTTTENNVLEIQPIDVDIPPVTQSVSDVSDFKEQYISRINTCLQTMDKTTTSNVVTAVNALSDSDPFWSAIVEKSAVIDVNPVEITSAVAVLPSEEGSSDAVNSGFIPFVYEPAFGNAKNYANLNPSQELAVIVEKTFGISSKSVNVGYLETQNLCYTYVISNANPDYAVICALYTYTENDIITRFGVETFARSYSGTYDSDGCMSSICNISSIPSENSFSDSYIVPEHRNMCDIAATIMSTGYYYQRSSADFVSVNDGSSYLDDCCHIRSAHYISWFFRS